MLESTGDDAGAEDDAAVFAVVYPVAGLEHGALLRHARVVGNEFQLLALAAACYEL